MVASKTVVEYKRNQEKIRNFCLEEKAEQARQQEAQAKQSKSAPLQTATVPQPESVINTKPIGHAEVVAMARKNQPAQKRPRPTFKQPSRQNQVLPKSQGTTKRPQ